MIEHSNPGYPGPTHLCLTPGSRLRYSNTEGIALWVFCKDFQDQINLSAHLLIVPCVPDKDNEVNTEV